MHNTNISLLDYLAEQVHVVCISDLKYLSAGQHRQMLRVIEKLSADKASLFEWNDALGYMTEALPADTSAEARATLILAMERAAAG